MTIKQHFKKLFVLLFCISSVCLLQACASTASQRHNRMANKQYLHEGKSNFIAGKYQLAFQQLIVPAEQGNASAQYAVGYMYYYGKGTQRNKTLGMKWIQRSAKQGYRPAQKSLQLLKN